MSKFFKMFQNSEDLDSKMLLPRTPEFGYEDYKDLKEFFSIQGPRKVFHSEEGIIQNGPTQAEVVPVQNLGISLREDVPNQPVLVPSQVEDPISPEPKLKSPKAPSDRFHPGIVSFGTDRALEQLMESRLQLQKDTMHGTLLIQELDPAGGEYRKDVHYLEQKNLGAGAFGKATLCIDTDTGKKFVKKEVKQKLLRDSEVLVPLKLKHENITKVFGLIQEENENGETVMSILMEYGGVNLSKFVSNYPNLSESRIFELLRGGLRGLEEMHKFGMIHLDLKPENLLVTITATGLILKLTDFGSAKLAQEKLEFYGNTPEYTAPECAILALKQLPSMQALQPAVITGKCDMFSMALSIMYIYSRAHVLVKLVMMGETTYQNISTENRNAKQVQLLFLLASEPCFVKNLIPDCCGLEMRNLLQGMTEYDPGQRWSARKARLHIEDFQRKQEQVTSLKSYQSAHQVTKPKPATQVKAPSPPERATQSMVPETAVNIMHLENGPVKNSIKEKLRKKLKPYPSLGKNLTEAARQAKWPASPGMAIPATPVEELNNMSLQYNPKSPASTSTYTGEEQAISLVALKKGGRHSFLLHPPLPRVPQMVEVMEAEDQPPLTGEQQREMQPSIPTPSLVGCDGLEDGSLNHGSGPANFLQSSEYFAHDAMDISGNVPNFDFLN